jgi:hypothetical protein
LQVAAHLLADACTFTHEKACSVSERRHNEGEHNEGRLTTPTNPQPSGMMAMLPATVWTRTFSTGEKGNSRWRERSLKNPKPIKLAGMVMVLTQPV